MGGVSGRGLVGGASGWDEWVGATVVGSGEVVSYLIMMLMCVSPHVHICS